MHCETDPIADAGTDAGADAGADAESDAVSNTLANALPDIGTNTCANPVTDASAPRPSNFITDTFEKVATEAGKLCKINKRDTLSSRDVQSAIRLVLPGELSKHAVSEGTKAMTKFQQA